MALMFQLEVARRLSASSNTPEYGRLSVMCQQSCVARNRFDLPGKVFVPPPKISATLVTVKPRVEVLAPAPLDALEYVCRQLFGQRRKQLSNAIKTLGEGMEPLLNLAQLDPVRRPDQLTVEEWCRFARVFKSWSVKTQTPIPLSYYGYGTEEEEEEAEGAGGAKGEEKEGKSTKQKRDKQTAVAEDSYKRKKGGSTM